MKKFLKFENVTDLDLAQTLDCGQSSTARIYI